MIEYLVIEGKTFIAPTHFGWAEVNTTKTWEEYYYSSRKTLKTSYEFSSDGRTVTATTYPYDDGDDETIKIKRYHYIRLTEMKNYAELHRLEEKYKNLSGRISTAKDSAKYDDYHNNVKICALITMIFLSLSLICAVGCILNDISDIFLGLTCFFGYLCFLSMFFDLGSIIMLINNKHRYFALYDIIKQNKTELKLTEKRAIALSSENDIITESAFYLPENYTVLKRGMFSNIRRNDLFLPQNIERIESEAFLNSFFKNIHFCGTKADWIALLKKSYGNYSDTPYSTILDGTIGNYTMVDYRIICYDGIITKYDLV